MSLWRKIRIMRRMKRMIKTKGRKAGGKRERGRKIGKVQSEIDEKRKMYSFRKKIVMMRMKRIIKREENKAKWMKREYYQLQEKESDDEEDEKDEKDEGRQDRRGERGGRTDERERKQDALNEH